MIQIQFRKDNTKNIEILIKIAKWLGFTFMGIAYISEEELKDNEVII